MDVYKEKTPSNGCLYKLNLIILVIEDLQNKEMNGNTYYPTASMSKIKYFLAYASKNKLRVHQLDFVGEFLQANVEHGFL